MSMYTIGPYRYSDELYHHGITGQKWGQRRFQYEDGSLTPAGRDRYGFKERLRERRQKYAEHLVERGRTLDEPHGHGFLKAASNWISRGFAIGLNATALNALTSGKYRKQISVGTKVLGSINLAIMVEDIGAVSEYRYKTGKY